MELEEAVNKRKATEAAQSQATNNVKGANLPQKAAKPRSARGGVDSAKEADGGWFGGWGFGGGGAQGGRP